MSNPIILRRIAALYAAGRIDDLILARYVANGILTQQEADAVMGGAS
ncbi:MAG: hypothetical protein VB092_06215 [Oscillospiraceae bacterium]|nr:hypothetical protein [Oscillospiraceae bacterium]